MAKPESKISVEKLVENLFEVEGGLPCLERNNLLVALAESRPTDFANLKPEDLVDLRNSAFAGAREWGLFSEHCGSYELFNG